jgi:hypothetical protein
VEQEPKVPGSQIPAEPTSVASPVASHWVATQPPVARRSRGARILNVALAGAFALAIAGVAFAAGRLTAPAAVTAGNFPNRGGGQVFPDSSGAPNGRPGDAGGFFAGGGVTIEGTVESITGTTLTLKTASGQTIQIALDSTTTYHAQTDATADDVTAAGKVLVRLDLRRADGSGTAANPSASDVTVVP